MKSREPPSSYNSDFFDMEREASVDGARAMVPRLIELLRPTSVVDVGCGLGAFLAEFQRLGVARILGVDGPWTRAFPMLIPADDLLALDLTGPESIPGDFDLALCLEVGEHLEERVGARLVERLTTLAPVVCFSAGVPSQRGTQHVNLHYPEYWARMFRARGFEPFDLLRSGILGDPSVPACYAQNTLIYGRTGSDAHGLLRSMGAPVSGRARFRVRNLAHPTLGRAMNSLPPRVLEFVYPFYTAGWYRFVQSRVRTQ